MLPWLEDSAEQLRERLDKLRGRVELRVEIRLDREAAARSSPGVQALREELARRPVGVVRLLERKLEQVEKRAAERLADGLYPELRWRLAVRPSASTASRGTRIAAESTGTSPFVARDLRLPTRSSKRQAGQDSDGAGRRAHPVFGPVAAAFLRRRCCTEGEPPEGF
jgi:hypothetical protein